MRNQSLKAKTELRATSPVRFQDKRWRLDAAISDPGPKQPMQLQVLGMAHNIDEQAAKREADPVKDNFMEHGMT
jgi:hypothetical protein